MQCPMCSGVGVKAEYRDTPHGRQLVEIDCERCGTTGRIADPAAGDKMIAAMERMAEAAERQAAALERIAKVVEGAAQRDDNGEPIGLEISGSVTTFGYP